MKSRELDKLDRNSTGTLIKIKIDEIDEDIESSDNKCDIIFRKKLSEFNQLSNHYRRKALNDYEDGLPVKRDGTRRG